ncbi:hypothetical protein LB542_29410 [Mesorhizobium sp. BR1-1-9]|uniref:hypothetical protein n=1 Tax=unclassified Mesorhizobium TaxID=325217 RepID=UPI00112BF435|nr:MULTISPECIES: hypothetical protein [unclassified Mesorhizobium]MBZ9807576.1 hypothetical protein [Mesorhizobium sp. ESP-6-2]MBZ9874953.1 hypothetical protein [Mesorhizobium sp. BR1-1-9]MBZ9942009.1 hypothetical protein [Mesorhizobium sp. BR1-1-13]TPM31346.1 hypothetical protein FJ955_10110 [Mesorhizobium sp. B2-2-2]
MKHHLIRYRTKPELVDENERLVKAVFQELRDKSPEGFRYMTWRSSDGTFFHLVEAATEEQAGTLPGLAAFETFQNGIRDRCIEPPHREAMTVVGSYRMLDQ